MYLLAKPCLLVANDSQRSSAFSTMRKKEKFSGGGKTVLDLPLLMYPTTTGLDSPVASRTIPGYRCTTTSKQSLSLFPKTKLLERENPLSMKKPETFLVLALK